MGTLGGKVFLFLCILIGIICQLDRSSAARPQKVCSGTSEGMATSGDEDYRYNSLRYRYTNCTYVDGSLEIKELFRHDHDLSFLESIEEVRGYVIISSVFLNRVPLKNLKIIRGDELYKFKGDEYSLYVVLNARPNTTNDGLLELGFKSLSEISRGKVYFFNNELMCYHHTIHWPDINPRVIPPVRYAYNAQEAPNCPLCHPRCYNEKTQGRNCWGAGEHMCQKLNHVICHATCDERCYGIQQNQCCHPECAAGCTGPKRTDCLACKNFNNDGECVEHCPLIEKYNRYKMETEENPDGKYSFGSLCVNDCPSHLLKDRQQSACVKSCKAGEHTVNKTCVKCDGLCAKRCKGLPQQEFLNAENIKDFNNCTIIDGNLRIVEATFDGDRFHNIPGLNPSDLYVLETVKEITGYLMIQSNHSGFTNLSFLSNLEIIHGRTLDSMSNALNIMATPLKSLELLSLKSIANGMVVIAYNMNLCYAGTVNFPKLFHNPKQIHLVQQNKRDESCEAQGEVCDQECQDGCWGKGINKCLLCKHMIVNSTKECLKSCDQLPRLYKHDEKVCRDCHEECTNNCSGPGPHNCDSCKHVYIIFENKTSGEVKRICLKECPYMFFSDANKECKPCHESCDHGCDGPTNEVTTGAKGCTTCRLGIEEITANGSRRMFCLPNHIEECNYGYFLYNVPIKDKGRMAGRQICKPCNSLCMTCYGQGRAQCTKCRHFKEDEYCVENCHNFNYPDLTSGMCKPCDEECRDGCRGPSPGGCFACKNYKIYDKEDPKIFNCTSECPPDQNYLVKDISDTVGMTVCAGESHPEVMARKAADAEEEKKKIAVIAGPVIGGVVLLAILLALFGYYWRQRARAQEKTARLTAKMTGYDDEPVTPTSAKPDMSSLRLIKESELRRGGIIGSGAFGTVYKGFWIPQEENIKIPVAIKVLQEGTSPNQNKELLEEARVMASVEHPCCIRILAVCMTAQMMLITQLMPLGCLLDYVRKHKDNIGSKVLLNWCTQIARGMAYLEERGIVHRDLAARNVLVQSPGQVKITDFGLAKLLDYNEDEYHAAGGKMPIKWLALECIQHRIFTHKSDVWSYGVTVWELFTYGMRPYENVRARDVPDLLEKGERLPQPPICTIDVYMIMIKCWMLDADSRPSFVELAEEFAKMARDPGRYLVIAGDVLKKIPDECVSPVSDLAEFFPEGTSDSPEVQAEHDRLMRLPSHSYDKNDLARSLSVREECPEEVIEADDYLQPRNSASLVQTPVSSKTPLLLNPHMGSASIDFKEKETHMQPRREKRYGHLESAAAARKQRELSPSRGRGNSVNSRYSSDPVQILRERDEPDGPDRQKSPVHNGLGDRGVHIKHGDVKIQLPVDEDDYLQPKSSKPRAYMDLTEGPDYINDKPVFEEDTSQYVQPDPVLNFDNPEYFDGEPSVDVKPRPIKLTNINRDYYNDLTDSRQGPETKPLVVSDERNSETAV